MGKRWRKYEVGRYSLQQLNGEAVVVWRDENRQRHRQRLGVFSESEGRVAVDTFISRFKALKECGDITVAMLWGEYVEDRRRDGKLVDVFEANWKALKPRFGDMPVTAINNDVCRRYAKDRIAEGRVIRRKGADGKIEEVRLPISVGTTWTELLRLRSCINWAWDHNRLRRLGLDAKPKVWVPRKPDPKKRVLTVDEFVRLRDACAGTQHMRLFVILAITTAGRSEAIVQLLWARVDFVAGTIDLREEPGKVDALSKRARKGRTIVPMTAEARSVLLEAKETALTGHVIEWDGSPVRKIRKGFQAAVRRAGLGCMEDDPTRPGKQRWVSDVTPHTLRHTALTWLEEEGIPIEMISKLAAHSGPEITRQVYLHSRPEVLRPAAEAIERRLQQQLLPAPIELRSTDTQP
jgi:integrase